MAKRQIKRNNKTATFFAEGGKKDVWGGISTALGGASGVLGSTMSMANTQLDPTVEANMDYNKTYQPTAYSNDALMEEWGNFSMLDHISRKQAGGKNAGSIAGGTLSGAGSGAAMGAGIGSIVPGIGTAIGAGVGAIFGGVSSLVGGLFGNNKAKRR